MTWSTPSSRAVAVTVTCPVVPPRKIPKAQVAASPFSRRPELEMTGSPPPPGSTSGRTVQETENVAAPSMSRAGLSRRLTVLRFFALSAPALPAPVSRASAVGRWPSDCGEMHSAGPCPPKNLMVVVCSLSPSSSIFPCSRPTTSGRRMR